jgi:predicted XRE-type DNA-binding protein
MTTRDRKDDDAVTLSSGNVFADLELDDAEELLAKSELAARIGGIIAERKLKQADAARLLGVDQPKVSKLVRGDLYGFSSDQLFRFLNALGHDIEIAVRPRQKRNMRGRIRVKAA